MGWFDEAWDRATTQARTYVDHAEEKFDNYVAELVNDPGRTATAVATLGGSELIREMGTTAAREMQREALQNLPSDPSLPPPATPATTEPKKEDPIAESIGEQRRARGRRATILTGRRGLGNSPTTTRRTLTGI